MSDTIIVALVTVFGGSMLTGIGWLVRTLYSNRKRDTEAEAARIAWQEEIAAEIAKLQEDFNFQHDRLEKVRILQLLQHEPSGSRFVMEEFAKYHSRGFNGYIEQKYKEWLALGQRAD